MRSYVAVSLKLAAGMSVVIALLTCILCEDILRIMRTPENIFEGAYAYLLVTFIGVPCTFFYNLLSSIIRALGDSKTPFWFLLFAAVLNIILDLFCILVLLLYYITLSRAFLHSKALIKVSIARHSFSQNFS